MADYEPVSIQYSLDKLGLGIRVLATHQGAIKDRLVAAFHQGLYAVGPASLPGQARTIWEGVWRDVTAIRGAENEASFGLSIEAITEGQAAEIAEKIWTVHSLTLWQALYLPEIK